MEWQWDSRLETGIEEIDKQHQELFNRIDQLELAIYKGKAAAELIKLMEYLESYILEHFELEEKLMLDNFFPDYAAHVHYHNEFRKICTDLLNNFKKKGGDSYLAIDIDKLMRNWWEKHILKMDMAYIPYLKNQ